MGKAANLKLTVKALFLVVILAVCNVSNAKIIYVDDSASGSNSGSSWTDAYVYLQDALAEASTGDEIRVAHGVYTPDMGGGNTQGDTDATFQLKNGVTIKGGYVGLDILEKSEERAFNIFESILSGNLSGDSDPNSWNSTNTSKTIIIGSHTDETAVLDGFTIIDNTSRVSTIRACMIIEHGSPTIKDCKYIFGSSATSSSGRISINIDSRPSFTKCIFENNYSSETSPFWSSYYYSSVMEIRDSNTVLQECIFNNNQSCLLNKQSNTVLKDCLFQNNSDTIIDQISGSLTIKGCSFTANSIHYDNAISPRYLPSCILNSNGDLTITDCLFTDNSFFTDFVSSGLFGGGGSCIYNNNPLISNGEVVNRIAKISNCDFINNSTNFGNCTIGGSAMIIEKCRFINNSMQNRIFSSTGSILSVANGDVRNCIFEGNTVNKGSIAEITSNLTNCTFYGNTSTDGVIAYNYDPYILKINGCIIRNNSPNLTHGNDINATYSNIEGGHSGEGNIDIDPDFVRAGYWADANNIEMEVSYDNPNAIWITGDYHLKSKAGRWDSDTETWVKDDISSPCIDAGNINSPIGLEPFPNGGVSNLGAYGRSTQASKTYFDGNNCDVILAGDINGDSIVGYDDLNIIMSQWLLEGIDFINLKPNVTFIEPLDGEEITWSGIFRLKAQANDIDGEIVSVIFLLEYRTETTSHSKSFRAQKEGDLWVGETDFSTGFHYGTWTMSAIATDN